MILGDVFERFVQVPGATRGGAGLGLSIARTIVKGHGGSLVAESETGRGSVFAANADVWQRPSAPARPMAYSPVATEPLFQDETS